MLLLSAEKITKSYSNKKLLQDISFYLNSEDKVGIIGINGTGKSTFLKIIADYESPDSGKVTKSSGIRIGYLPQNPIFEENLTILEQVFKACSQSFKEENDYLAKTILNKLGITDFNSTVTNLSGGEKKRVAIASVLVNPCEILILDEPTNHLDNEMVLWLENYLRKYTGSLMMITHDRYFLDRVTNKIVEISNGNLFSYTANYTQYLEIRAAREQSEIATERKNKSLFRKELAWIQRGPRARGTKSKSRIEKFETLRDREGVEDGEKLTLSSVSTRLGRKIIEINDLSKKYGDKQLIRHFDLVLLRDARLGIIGKNGSGKSTFLKMIMGQSLPDTGTISIGETVKIGYFSQEVENVSPSLRVIDYIKNVAENIVTVDGILTASQLLELFLFTAEQQYTTIERLSGGERRRLFLCRILMEAPNILLLDEPTNDLDIEALVVLEDYLSSFNGAVVVVSHDRYFLDKVIHSVLEMNDDGVIKKYNGGYSDYLEKKDLDISLVKTQAPVVEKIKTTNTPKNKNLKFSFHEQKEFKEIDKVIADLEADITSMDEKIQKNASNYSTLQQLMAEKEQLETTLAEKMDRWVYLNDLAEKIEANSL